MSDNDDQLPKKKSGQEKSKGKKETKKAPKKEIQKQEKKGKETAKKNKRGNPKKVSEDVEFIKTDGVLNSTSNNLDVPIQSTSSTSDPINKESGVEAFYVVNIFSIILISFSKVKEYNIIDLSSFSPKRLLLQRKRNLLLLKLEKLSIAIKPKNQDKFCLQNATD